MLAAVFIGMIGISWSLAYQKVFTVAGVIPMFPGISAYTAMIMITHFLKASVIDGVLSIVLWL